MKLKLLEKNLVKAKEQLKRLEEKHSAMNNRIQLADARGAKLKRAARTRHLIIIGAVAEKYFPQLHELDEQGIDKFFKNL